MHDDEAIARSLAENGQYKPITVRDDGTVIVGNGTYAAALSLGWTHIAATRVEVTEEQARRIVLVDNRTHDLGGYDDALLAELLQQGDLGEPAMTRGTSNGS